MITIMRHENNNTSSYFQKGLSEWWNEESEYFIQRIEKWAGIARGYNRLKSRKSFDNDDDDDIEDSSRRWKNLNALKKTQQRRKSHTTEEKTKINCCGTFKYQSNNNFDNTCLETYRYDHSIYFKTIGDIKNRKNEGKLRNDNSVNNNNTNNKMVKCFNDDVNDEDEKVEWQVENKNLNNNVNNCNCYNQSYVTPDNSDFEKYLRTVWPNITEFIEDAGNEDNYMDDDIVNNNYINYNNFHNNGNYYVRNKNENKMDNRITDSSNSRNTKLKNFDNNLTRFFKLRRASSKSSTKTRKSSSVIYGDNNVSWPSVLLNYTKNMDPALSTAHRRAFNNVQLNHY